MKIAAIFSKACHSLISLLIIASFFFSSTAAFAYVDRVRDTSIEEGRCFTDKIDFNPLGSSDDIEWELDNHVCQVYIATSGVAVWTAENVSSYACYQPQAAREVAMSAAAGVVLSPKMVKRRAKEATKCSALISSGSYGQAAACCGGMSAALSATGVAISALAIIWNEAVQSQSRAIVCGDKWNTWQEINRNDEENGGFADYQGGDNDVMQIYGKKPYSYQKYLEELFQGSGGDRILTNQKYREYIYGGVEYEDNGSGKCYNPEAWSSTTRKKILGYDDDRQRYYMRGPRVSANYACGRFLSYKGSDEENASAKEAYECCKERSQKTICIAEIADSSDGDGFVSDNYEQDGYNKGSSWKFCKLGDRCKVEDVWYEIYQAKQVPNYICSKTYSVCPYNHSMGGGTEIREFDLDYPDIVTNNCQYLKHCVKKPNSPYIRTSNLDGGWISSACFDMKGNSQNEYEYGGPLIPIHKTRNFSAPIAQCFKETLENIFINKAGNTKCLDPEEEPDGEGICDSGYAYKEGEVMQGQQSFFQKLQDGFRIIIKTVMTAAVVVLGFGILMAGNVPDKKTIMMFVIKLALVSYFALGTAWQDFFFRGVSNASAELANIFMRIDQNQPEDKQDGCQFPRYKYDFVYNNNLSVEDNKAAKFNNPDYPPGKSYLAIWDMLDCKIVRALGFGPEVSVPNLILMILAGFLTNGLGIVFFVATFIFAFYLLALTIRALHIFLIASMAITIMIFISPITITAALFKRTENIYKQWLANLIGFVLQPVILFAYIGLLIVMFEVSIMGDAKFVGDGKIYWNHIDEEYQGSEKKIDCSNGDAANNSIYCIFQFNNIKTNNALSPIGISLPVLFDMNKAKLITIIKAAFLLFIFSKFLDQIVEVSKRIIGGVGMTSGSKGSLQALGKAYAISRAIQSRGTNATKKWGGKAARKTASTAKSIARTVGRKGKTAKDTKNPRSTNPVAKDGSTGFNKSPSNK